MCISGSGSEGDDIVEVFFNQLIKASVIECCSNTLIDTVIKSITFEVKNKRKRARERGKERETKKEIKRMPNGFHNIPSGTPL